MNARANKSRKNQRREFAGFSDQLSAVCELFTTIEVLNRESRKNNVEADDETEPHAR